MMDSDADWMKVTRDSYLKVEKSLRLSTFISMIVVVLNLSWFIFFSQNWVLLVAPIVGPGVVAFIWLHRYGKPNRWWWLWLGQTVAVRQFDRREEAKEFCQKNFGNNYHQHCDFLFKFKHNRQAVLFKLTFG